MNCSSLKLIFLGENHHEMVNRTQVIFDWLSEMKRTSTSGTVSNNKTYIIESILLNDKGVVRFNPDVETKLWDLVNINNMVVCQREEREVRFVVDILLIILTIIACLFQYYHLFALIFLSYFFIHWYFYDSQREKTIARELRRVEGLVDDLLLRRGQWFSNFIPVRLNERNIDHLLAVR